MPELPEVETVVRGLSRTLLGSRILRHQVFDKKLQSLYRVDLRGFKIEAVNRLGKEIVFTLTRAKTRRYLLVHLRMTGRLLWWQQSIQKKTQPQTFGQYLHSVTSHEKYVRFTLECDKGILAFADVRRFGTVRLRADSPVLEAPRVDPLTEEFTAERCKELFARGSQPIKPWLLRQDRIVGIGNIYASEALFRAGILPHRPCATLTAKEIIALRLAIREILQEAILAGGTTISDYLQPSGATGDFQLKLCVYERKDLPCPRCRAAIIRTVQAGRSTYHCPRCQN